ncbi:hypothetical protein ACTFRD_28295 [Bacillus cereus group sp. MYBK249-1]|uniref:hypothetical protein n=1 Tax=unclassified Bacillus cereus group TaxID=2750818 RepID=UPI003F7A6816
MKQFIILGVLGTLILLGIILIKSYNIKHEETQDYVIGYVKELIKEEEFEVAKSIPKKIEFVRVEYTSENGIKKDVLIKLTKGQKFNLDDRVKVGNKKNWEKNSKTHDNIEKYY